MTQTASVKTPANPRGLRDLPFELPTPTPHAKRRARRVLTALEAEYPDAHCELDYSSPHELLVATILSAQATDVGVNKATPSLFRAFPTPADYARAAPADIEPHIKSIGLFRNKAKSIHAAMSAVTTEFGGRVPDSMDDLLSLRGVARKTANVVLGNAFGINVGFVVDTHVSRFAVRFGFVEEGTSVAMTERWLMALLPRDKWTLGSHLMIFHGRRACTARTPRCEHPICRNFKCENAS